MNLYIFKFRGGAVFSIPAKNKLKAIQIVAENYTRLFESESFELLMVTNQMDENGEEEYDNLG